MVWLYKQCAKISQITFLGPRFLLRKENLINVLKVDPKKELETCNVCKYMYICTYKISDNKKSDASKSHFLYLVITHGLMAEPKNWKTPFFSRYSKFLLMSDWKWSKNALVFSVLKNLNKYGR